MANRNHRSDDDPTFEDRDDDQERGIAELDDEEDEEEADEEYEEEEGEDRERAGGHGRDFGELRP
jgi:hypothetical protein